MLPNTERGTMPLMQGKLPATLRAWGCSEKSWMWPPKPIRWQVGANGYCIYTVPGY
jgi:hypothetical protein